MSESLEQWYDRTFRQHRERPQWEDVLEDDDQQRGKPQDDTKDVRHAATDKR